MASPNGYERFPATVLTAFEYVSMHSTLNVPASAKQSSPVWAAIAREFGSFTLGLDNRISLSVPSKLDHSIFGDSRFQSDQYNLL